MPHQPKDVGVALGSIVKAWCIYEPHVTSIYLKWEGDIDLVGA